MIAANIGGTTNAAWEVGAGVIGVFVKTLKILFSECDFRKIMIIIEMDVSGRA